MSNQSPPPSLSPSLKESFLSSTAHDIRNPLHTLMIHTECLLDELYGTLTPELREAIAHLNTATSALNGWMNTLLVFSQWEGRVLSIAPSEFDLVDLLKTVKGIVSEKAKARGIEVTIEGSSCLPIQADKDKIQQVALHLLALFVRFSESKSLSVRIERVGLDAQFSLADPSFYLTEEECVALEQLHKASRDGRFGGRMVGIGMAEAIVKLHKGHFQVDRKEGLKFQVRLPCRL